MIPFVSVAALVLMLDRLTKEIALRSLTSGRSIEAVPGIFHFTLVFNKGMAFGLFTNGSAVFIVLTCAAIIAVLMYVVRCRPARISEQVSLGLITGGAIGNLIDRLRFGSIVDFLDFRVWPVFNLADTSITIGAALLTLTIVFKKQKGA